jgi:hypothetical protein
MTPIRAVDFIRLVTIGRSWGSASNPKNADQQDYARIPGSSFVGIRWWNFVGFALQFAPAWRILAHYAAHASRIFPRSLPRAGGLPGGRLAPFHIRQRPFGQFRQRHRPDLQSADRRFPTAVSLGRLLEPIAVILPSCNRAARDASWVLPAKRGRTGFDLVLKAQAACRGRPVGLLKSSGQKNNCQLRRSGSRGLIDRDVPDRTHAKAGSDDSRLA